MIREILLLCGAAVLTACKPSVALRPGTDARPWPYVDYTTVVGYYFPKGGSGDDSSVLKREGEGLDEVELQRVKEQEKPLSPAQVTRLLQAGFESKFRFSRAACYDAHHICVFYNKDRKAVAACEFCLECKAFAEWPGNESIHREYNQRVDFVELARLCSELGLKLGPPHEIKEGPRKGQVTEPNPEGVIEQLQKERRPAE